MNCCPFPKSNNLFGVSIYTLLVTYSGVINEAKPVRLPLFGVVTECGYLHSAEFEFYEKVVFCSSDYLPDPVYILWGIECPPYR